MNAVKDLWQEISKSMTWTKKELPDLEGCTILVTGATDGVGYDSALAFAEHGAHVIVHGRDQAKGDHAVAEIKKTASPKAKVEYMQGDLSDFK
jgi:NAD(P)-dependent dehydrogenase (short-subunit alcohol dehydrogenase family)